MKKYPILISLAALLAALAGCATPGTTASPESPANVTVTFQDSEKFTDARSDFGSFTDKGYLKILEDHLTKTAGKKLAAGQKLEVTFTDIDLAGEFLPTGRADQIRVIKEIFRPRMTLTFKLTDAAGAVVKEGDRTLTDLNFMSNLSLVGRSEELFYDKALLSDWINREFRP